MRTLWMVAAALTLAACGDEQSAARTAGGRTTPAATPAATAAGPNVKPESRSFRDWRVTCDNTNACVAFTGSGGVPGWIRIAMPAGPDAQPTVAVGVWPDTGDDVTGPPTVNVDGRHFAARSGPAYTSSGVIAAGDARALVSGVTAGQTLTLSAPGVAEPPSLSVSGASAAMLWIDERQGRLDTTTALIRKGAKPASAVPAAPLPPTITPATAVSQAGFTGPLDPINDDRPSPALPAPLEALASVKECRANLDFNPDLRKAVTGSRLNATTELWGVPCDSGAYNFTFAWFLTGPGGTRPEPADFPGTDGIGIDGMGGTELVNSTYNPATRTMTAFAKGRGVGDCGVAQTWVWTGRAFALTSERQMSECWGIVSDYWPTTFRSR